MKNYLPTFTFCGKVQGFEEPFSFLQIFVGLYWTGLETRRQIAKEKNENKRGTKKEKLKKKNIHQGRGNKPKMKACLNLQVIRKVAN